MSELKFGCSQSSVPRHQTLVHVAKGSKHVLEIGSYEGASAYVFSHVVGRDGSVFCVDTWKPYLHDDSVRGSSVGEQMQRELEEGIVFERFKENIKLMDCSVRYYVGNIEQAYRSGALNYLFDLVYIDGNHLYREVMTDLEYGARLVREGGILCGDDLEKQGDMLVSDEDQHREYNGNYHPGVTRAVWDFFGRHVWCRDAVWAVRNVNGKWLDFAG